MNTQVTSRRTIVSSFSKPTVLWTGFVLRRPIWIQASVMQTVHTKSKKAGIDMGKTKLLKLQPLLK